MDTNFSYCKVTAIIRCEVLKKVEQRIEEIGVYGITVTQVQGYGEYTDFYSRDCMTTHSRVEIFTSDQRADEIARAIMDAAHSGLEGDGIVAVLPVKNLYRIRNRAEVKASEL